MPLPKPRKGEKQNDFISRCMSAVKDEFPGQKQRTAVCFSQWRQKEQGEIEDEDEEEGDEEIEMEHFKYPMRENWQMLEFNVPIIENYTINDEFIIKGKAISETTTHNNHKYIAEELEKAAPSLLNKPLLIDHENKVESIKGRVVKSYFDKGDKSVHFEAKVMDKTMREMIKDGRITNVSIGAYAKDLVKEEDGSLIAKDLKVAELSLVAVPADENATIAVAMDRSYQLKESANKIKENARTPGFSMSSCMDKMAPHVDDPGAFCRWAFDQGLMKFGENVILTKEEVERDVKKFNETQEIIERRFGEMEELETLKKELAFLKEENQRFKVEKKSQLTQEYKRLCQEKGIKEKDVEKVSEDVIIQLIEHLREIPEKKEMKSEIVRETPKEIENYVYERSGKGYALWAKPDEKGNLRIQRW